MGVVRIVSFLFLSACTVDTFVAGDSDPPADAWTDADPPAPDAGKDSMVTPDVREASVVDVYVADVQEEPEAGSSGGNECTTSSGPTWCTMGTEFRVNNYALGGSSDMQCGSSVPACPHAWTCVKPDLTKGVCP